MGVELIGHDDIHHLLVSLETMGEDVGLCQLLEGLGALEHLGDQRRVERRPLDVARNSLGTISS